jgi:aldehyde dehydrogenase (NAD+)
LGGKNPVFVDKNSDLDHAAKRVVWGRMLNAGQQCIAPDYVLCDAAVVDEFSAACERQVKAMYPTRGDVARIVDQRKMKRITDLYNATLKHPETKIVVGGEIDAKAKYFAPTVLRVSREAALMQEETFGPVLLITTYTDVAEAIAYVNSRDKPLSLYVFSDDAEYQQQVSQNTSSGGVTINAVIFHCAHPELPFGGVGASGCGAYHGQASIDCFTHWKPVLKKGIWKDGGLVSNPFFLYPPVSASKLKWLEMAIGN